MIQKVFILKRLTEVIAMPRQNHVIFALFLMVGMGCPQSENTPAPEKEPCVWDDDCEEGEVCVSGICRIPAISLEDAGTDLEPVVDSDGGPLAGILEPVESGAVEFGAQRLGVSVQRTV